MKNILLIEVGARHTLYPPIGLIHIASVLRRKYNVFIKDYSGEEIDEERVKGDIIKTNPFVVGVRVLTGPPIPRAIKVSKIAKSLNKLVVWGGPHPTILPKQTLENKNIDAVVIGEGEYTFQTLLKYYQGKKEKLEGVGIKEKKGKICIFKPTEKSVDLNKKPLPAWDLVENVNKYFPNRKHNSVPISTTRGCAFKCGFCHNSNANVKAYLGRYRITDPQRAIDEFKAVKAIVKNEIEILDVGEDLHLVSEAYTEKFCMAIHNSKLKIKWTTAARYQTLNEKLVNMIADAGCIRILLGVESGSARIQKMNNKVVELDKAIRIAKLLRKRGIFVTNAYIFGHPTETLEELKRTLDFIKKIPADENLIQLYRPMPATPYFQLCLNEGKVDVPATLEGWSDFGVLGSNVNLSHVPSKILFSAFYRMNAWQQSKYWFNQQRFFLRNNMREQFLENFFNNRFTFKFKEFLGKKK